MKPADQVKVIVLSFVAIVVMVGFIVVVSKITHNTYMSHHAEAGHGDAEAGHGDGHGETSHTSTEDSHGDTHAKTEDTHATTPGSTEDHAADAHHDADKAADKTTDAHAGDSHDTPAEVTTVAVSGDPEAGAQVFMAKTCATCHAVSSLEGAVGAVGPKLDGLGATAATRQPGKDAVTYIRESIENPSGYVVEGYPAAMPALKSTMSDEEFDNLVAYLTSL
ncbi:MAG: cytochrome c [Candidatus Sericytochromatia bacterium]|nr:cytochrome c [Candidatus Sericytochromatia bacterium]